MKTQKKTLYELMKEYSDMYVMFTPVEFSTENLNIDKLRKDAT